MSTNSKCVELQLTPFGRKILSFCSKFRKYKSATIHFTKPYVEKHRKEFEDAIGGRKVYEKLILTISTVICPIHPFQSASFDLGHDSSITSSLYFNGNARERGRQFRQMSEQLAHLWKELNQNPTILYAYQSDLCKEFAQAMKKVNIGDNAKDRSEEIYDSYLIIIDRSMDTKTPLMYDLTFQVR